MQIGADTHRIIRKKNDNHDLSFVELQKKPFNSRSLHY